MSEYIGMYGHIIDNKPMVQYVQRSGPSGTQLQSFLFSEREVREMLLTIEAVKAKVARNERI